MRAVFDLARAFAGNDGTVLITGETGTGKEVTAGLIHHESPRQGWPFVPISCALFSETLIESELFGHERGAFTGAVKERPGRFELARGGTVFLDDIDDVPLAMQVKLLRVLQSRTVERVGGVQSIPVDVRVIAASKRDLRQLVAEGRFRDDLYYRLNVLPVTLPPLRDRREDIPALMEHFLAKSCPRGQPVPSVTPAIRRAFVRYSWPGNIRELENLCERIVLSQGCGPLTADCVPEYILACASAIEDEGEFLPAPPGPVVPFAAEPISLDARLRDLECSLILWALRTSGGNKSKAAQLLKLSRSTLRDRITRCGLDDEAADGEPIGVRVSA
jgi:DNA-binding NtrC family response regulator